MPRLRLSAILVAAASAATLLHAESAAPGAGGNAATHQKRRVDLVDPMYSIETGTSNARFRVRFDGSTDEPLGLAVLRTLDAAWAEYGERLGARPKRPVTVVLQTAASFHDTTRAPEWAAGWNDGTIRVPARGISAPNPELVRVLRHELAHSFVAAAAGARCPIWLHEGVAQWLEGGDPAREDAMLAARARRSRLPRLESLEDSFVKLSKHDAANAYAASLSVVAHIVRLRGEAGLRRLLAALAAGDPIADALPRALGMSYAGLQNAWELRVRTAEKQAPIGASQ